MPTVITPATGKRATVQSHLNRLENLSAKQKYAIKRLVTKFYMDFRSVAEKKGTKAFSVPRWLDENI